MLVVLSIVLSMGGRYNADHLFFWPMLAND